jgi:hypothetical protein
MGPIEYKCKNGHTVLGFNLVQCPTCDVRYAQAFVFILSPKTHTEVQTD